MSSHMDEVWIIGVPNEGNSGQKTLSTLTDRTQGFSRNFKFEIPPELKVGTLDSLVSLSDDLGKVDSFVQGVTFKLSQYMFDLLPNKTQFKESLSPNGLTVEGYLTTFRWDKSKFNVQQSVRDISKEISKKVSDIETEMKSKMAAYNKVKGNLQAIERRSNGSLMIRSLQELVKPELFVLDSEYLVTLLVVVPRYQYKDWQQTYEKLDKHVVPRSTELVSEDNEFGLWTVTLFRRVVDDFKAAARESRFIVRDFEYDSTHAANSLKERTELEEDLNKKLGLLVKWCALTFGEAFMAWIHLKALRVFVEAVLRYGLPVNFQAVAIILGSNKKRLRQMLKEQYQRLDSKAGIAGEDDGALSMAASLGAQEYFPYVSFTLDMSGLA